MTKKNNSDSDSVLQSYIAGIQRYKLLTFEEELALSRRIEKGDKDALNTLIHANLRLVVRIARCYLTPELGFMDLIQEGNIGLMKAAQKYNHRKQVRFATYASWWVKQTILRSAANLRRTIHLPQRKEENLKRLLRVIDEFSQHLCRQPSIKELAAHTGMKTKEVARILDMAGVTVSLDAETPGGNLLDIVGDSSYCPDEELIRKSMTEDTHRFLNMLKDKEKAILTYRFALNGEPRQTLKTIGQKMGISPETVRQIEMKALSRLRQEVEPIREYIFN